MSISSLLLVTYFLFSFLSLYSAQYPVGLECLSDSTKTPIAGAGATFPQPVYSEWMFAYELTSAGATVLPCYYSCGSGCGKSCIETGSYNGNSCPVSFGASDSLLGATDYAAVPDAQMFPMVAGAVVPMYNINQTSIPLVLSRDVLADIFMCEITHWRDPRIIATNNASNQLCPQGNTSSPGCLLPDAAIKVYRRFEGSGTTETFTRALTSFSTAWASLAGPPSQTWPTSVAAKCPDQGTGSGNYGTFAYVISTPNSITYVSYGVIQTAGTGVYARIINKDGYTVTATLGFIQAAMKYTIWNTTTFSGDFIDTPGETWPISTYTYIIFRKQQVDGHPTWKNCERTRESIKFWTWCLESDYAQKRATALGYVYLESTIASWVTSNMSQTIYCDSKPAIISFQFEIGVVFPLTGAGDLPTKVWQEMLNFATLKANQGNYSSSGLKGWEFVLNFADSKHTQAGGLLASSQLSAAGVKAIIGEFTDSITNTMQILLSDLQIAQLSPVADKVAPQSESTPSLVRLETIAVSQASPIIATVAAIGWHHVAILFGTDSESLFLSSQLFNLSLSYNISASKFPLSSGSAVDSDFQGVLNSGIRVIITCIPPEDLSSLLPVAQRVGLLGTGYTWFFSIYDNSPPTFEDSFLEDLVGAYYFLVPTSQGSMYESLLDEILHLNQSVYPDLIQYVNSTGQLDLTSQFIYDLMFAFGWGFDKVTQGMSAFDIQEYDFANLAQSLLAVSFEGLNGLVAFDTTGNRLAFYQVMNLQDQHSPHWVHVGRFNPLTFELNVTGAIVSGGDFENPSSDYIPPTDTLVKLSWHSPLGVAGIVLTVIGEIVVFYFFVETFHFNDRKIIRAASLFFLRLVLAGASIGIAGNILNLAPVNKGVCITYPWILWTGFTLVFGGLHAKTFRVWKIFYNPRLSNSKLSNSRVLASTFIIFVVNAIIIILWQTIDTPYVTHSGHYYQSGKVTEQCESTHQNMWWALFLIPFFILLIGLSIVSFMIRNISSKFNESRFIALSIYHFTFCFIVSLSIAIALHDFLEFQAGILFIGIWIGIMGILFILYLPKIWTCYFDPNASNTLQRGSRGTHQSSATPGSVHSSSWKEAV